MTAKITRLNASQSDFNDALAKLLAWDDSVDHQVNESVRHILHEVKTRGDQAVLEFTEKFDRLKVGSVAELEMDQSRLQQALDAIPQDQRVALEKAAERIRDYHERQNQKSWQYEDEDGTVLGQKVTPLDRAGLYVPGGKAAYPSSVLMNAIPAKVAGVSEVVMVVPAPSDEVSPVVLAAAHLAGVDSVFTVGGAQAIAALAYGTATVPRVDKIVGPGNRFVAEAKRQVFGRVGIDMVAGPSEILIIADGSVKPEWVAMDLFAQAEHDEYAQAVLISPDAEYLDAVDACIADLLPSMARRDIVSAALKNRGALIKVPDLDAAAAFSNRIAPEHLELAVADPQSLIERIGPAGAIFMGAMSSESLGDYCAGPNHVLPTAGSARFASPLGVYDFQRRSSLIEISPEGARSLGEVAATLADAESLEAHGLSARLRLRDGD